MNYEELGYMGKFARVYRPGFANLHRLTNDLFGAPSRIAFPTSAVVVQQKKIPDVSFWQGEIDFAKMRQKTDALIIRAGQNTWVDSQFRNNWRLSKQHSILRGSYWFYDDRVSPGKQAEIWADLLDADEPEMEIWVDWENTYGGSFGGLRNVVAMMQAMELFLPTVEVGMYTGYWWFREHSNAVTNAGQYTYLKDRKLFEAFYTPSAANVLIPNPWTSMHLWQFGTPDEGPDHGVQTAEIDMSFINMTEAEFGEKYGVAVPPTPQPPIGGTMPYYELKSNTTKSRSIRSGPGVKNPKLVENGDLFPGKIAKAGTAPADVYVYSADVPDSSILGGYAARRGDTWRKVFENDGHSVAGWIAKVHLGQVMLTEELVAGPSAPTFPPEMDVTIQGVTKTYMLKP